MASYSAYNDQQLLKLVQQDDESAFGQLYDRYWDKLLTQAFIKLRSHEEAEETVQEIFLQLWRRRHTIELRYTFHTYIAAVLKYEILSKLAGRKREAHAKMNFAVVSPMSDNSTLEKSNFDLLLQKIEKTVQLLPEKCRLVFRLSREAGLSEKQIAETLNIAPKTVEAHMSKALKSLRVSLRQFLSFCFFL